MLFIFCLTINQKGIEKETGRKIHNVQQMFLRWGHFGQGHWLEQRGGYLADEQVVNSEILKARLPGQDAG